MRAEVQKVLESSREPCAKKEKIVSTLVGAGLPYRRREPIIAILMHPKTRPAKNWGAAFPPHGAVQAERAPNSA